jgi:nucleotide-binding universal stress UspA family protein
MNALTTQQRAGWAMPAPTNMGEAMRMAELLANSTMVPKSYQGRPGDVLVAVQMGAELGLAPLQALQNIASVNGRPSVWGDAALALVQSHPAYVSHREWIEGEGEERAGYCAVTRRGSPEHVQRFGVKEAKKAGLWGKAGPWQQYPDRMMVLRARGFAIRDKFADALRGVITTEEAQDMPADAPAVVGVVVPDAPALAGPAAAMDNPNTMQSFTLSALDDQLAQFWHVDEINAYLNQEAVQKAKARAERAGRADKWAEIVAAHYARVVPEEREGEVEPEAAGADTQADYGWPGPKTSA